MGQHRGSGAVGGGDPDGHIVFVIKPLRVGGVSWDFSTAAYDAATGKQLWASRYNGHGRGADTALAIAVSPRGGTVFVTGISSGRSSDSDFATVAYAAGTGATLWTKRYDNAGEEDGASSVAASPDGRRVFVTGGSRGRNPGTGFATVSYAAATGARLWVRRYHAPADRNDTPGRCSSARAAAERWSYPEPTTPAAMSFTVAAKIATSAQSWVKAIRPTSGTDTFGVSGAVSPDGGTVYVVVDEFTAGSPEADFTTIAFQA